MIKNINVYDENCYDATLRTDIFLERFGDSALELFADVAKYFFA